MLKDNSIAGVRRLIFLSWLGAWIICIFQLAISKFVLSGIDTQDVTDSVLSVTGIFTPVLGCLATLWFAGRATDEGSERAELGEGRASVAKIITFIHLLLIILWIFYEAYLGDIGGPEFDAASLPKSATSWSDGIMFCVRWASLTSPLGTLPVIWLNEGKSIGAAG